MGPTNFVYHTNIDDEEFIETFRFTFHCPFLDFAGFSTHDLTALEFRIRPRPNVRTRSGGVVYSLGGSLRPPATLRCFERYYITLFRSKVLYRVWGGATVTSATRSSRHSAYPIGPPSARPDPHLPCMPHVGHPPCPERPKQGGDASPETLFAA